MSLDVGQIRARPANLLDPGIGGRDGIRTTPFACAKTGLLRFYRGTEERDPIAARSPDTTPPRGAAVTGTGNAILPIAS